jgi:CheY-like chemotaxis protein
MNRILRLLIIEDDAKRESTLRSWLPPEVKPVVATSAGQAIGILRRDAGCVYSGILLDHDLQDRVASEADQFLCGQDVVKTIAEFINHRVPILVHSVNASQSAVMARQLQTCGFEVTKIPMKQLTPTLFGQWLSEILEHWREDEPE